MDSFVLEILTEHCRPEFAPYNPTYALPVLSIPLFLQHGRIACNAERCISHNNAVGPSVRHMYPIPTNEDKIMRSSLWSSKNIIVFCHQ